MGFDTRKHTKPKNLNRFSKKGKNRGGAALRGAPKVLADIWASRARMKKLKKTMLTRARRKNKKFGWPIPNDDNILLADYISDALAKTLLDNEVHVYASKYPHDLVVHRSKFRTVYHISPDKIQTINNNK